MSGRRSKSSKGPEQVNNDCLQLLFGFYDILSLKKYSGIRS